MRTHKQPVKIRANDRSITYRFAKMSFDRIFDLTAGVYFNFHNIYARSEYHTQLAKMSFDQISDLTAGVYFNFYDIYIHIPDR